MATATTLRAAFKPSPYLIGSAVLFVLAFVYAIYLEVTLGHVAFNTTNYGVFWGFPIVAYDYFLLTSTGLALVASLPLAVGIRSWDPVAKRCVWLAIAALVGGVAILFLELPHPLRALWATPINLQTASPLFWKILCVGAYTIVLALLAYAFGAGRGPAEVPRILAVVLGLLALAITLIAGSVYGMLVFRPFWFGSELPVVFLIESFMGGIAFFIFFTYAVHGFVADNLSENTRRLLAGPLGIAAATAVFLHLLFVLTRTVTGLWSYGEGMEVWRYTIAQPLYWLALIGGGLVPLVVFALPSLRAQPWLQMIGAFLVALGLLASRYEFMINGQLVPPFKGSWAPPLLEYAPSQLEWVLLFVGIFLANTIYAALESWSSTRER
ncbi:MAG: polysulfide reductase NrfD [Geminicoccaceae bacterium]|nr:polysulfide reductase NrfD [Geminicoccaceae bacterium]